MILESIRRKTGRRVLVAAAAAAMLGGAVAAEAATPEEKCQSGKNSAAGKYASCVATAEKVYVLTGDAVKYGASLAKCQSKMATLWSKLEQKAVDAMTTCPSTGDQVAIKDFLDACTQSVAVALGGDPLPLNPIACEADLSVTNADLTTCQDDLVACLASAGGLPRTGQTTAYGAGSDGDLERGLARSFTDNGDGTITDNTTGLMWEKKSDDGSIHDKDNTYTWSTGTNNMDGTIVTTFLATLNGGGGFAGYADWRIPNRFELESLLRIETLSPATYSQFNSGCVGGCTVTTCSCTRSWDHWSSTTYQITPSNAWFVGFYDGISFVTRKTNDSSVRAVRAGS